MTGSVNAVPPGSPVNAIDVTLRPPAVLTCWDASRAGLNAPNPAPLNPMSATAEPTARTSDALIGKGRRRAMLSISAAIVFQLQHDQRSFTGDGVKKPGRRAEISVVLLRIVRSKRSGCLSGRQRRAYLVGNAIDDLCRMRRPSSWCRSRARGRLLT